MSQKCKCAKKLVLLKTLYYTTQTQDDQSNANSITFITNPVTSSRTTIRHLTDKNYYPIKNDYILFIPIRIPPNNPISGITTQTFQYTIMIKTKCGFVSTNTFFNDSSSDNLATASSGDLKNAFQITIETDDDGTIFSNGVKHARRVRVYGCK